jgi:hypothetical protein
VQIKVSANTREKLREKRRNCERRGGQLRERRGEQEGNSGDKRRTKSEGQGTRHNINGLAFTWGFSLIRDDAAHEVRICALQRRHKPSERLLSVTEFQRFINMVWYCEYYGRVKGREEKG